MTQPSDIEAAIRGFILEEFLAGEDPGLLRDSTALISTGVLDSIATLRLVAFLEQRFGIEMSAHETDAEHLDSIDRMARLVRSKQGPEAP